MLERRSQLFAGRIKRSVFSRCQELETNLTGFSILQMETPPLLELWRTGGGVVVVWLESHTHTRTFVVGLCVCVWLREADCSACMCTPTCLEYETEREWRLRGENTSVSRGNAANRWISGGAPLPQTSQCKHISSQQTGRLIRSSASQSGVKVWRFLQGLRSQIRLSFNQLQQP